MNHRVEEKYMREKLRDIKDRIKWSNIGLGLPKWVKRYLKRTSRIPKRHELVGSRITRRSK